MLNDQQKEYLRLCTLSQAAPSADQYVAYMSRMDELYANFTSSETDAIEEWLDRLYRGEETEDITDLGY